MAKFEIVKVAKNEDGFPYMHIKIKDGTLINEGFLSPFRGYKFQVSTDNEGNLDLGSSEVIGLANVIGVSFPERKNNLSIWSSNLGQENMIKYFLLGLSYIAISNWNRGRAYVPVPILNGFRADDQLWTEFIDLTVDYVKKLM